MTNKYHLSPVEILSHFSEYSLPPNFCIVPFTNVILNPEGLVSICREKGTKHVVGNLNNNTIEEIWNNDYLKKWRSEFLSGEVEICKDEIQSHSCHLASGSYFFIDKAYIEVNQKNLPIKLTANFNGKCNLKCKMCDVWTLSNGFYDRINYWDELRLKFFPYIQEIELLSGEPFIQEDTWKLVDEISIVNPECIWSFTTNAHYELTPKMMNSLNKIKIKNIIISLESLDPQKYEKIRIGGNLARVLKTLGQLRNFNLTRSPNDQISLNIHFLVMEDNWKELNDVINFCDKNNFMLTINSLIGPHEMSLNYNDEKKRIEIIEELMKVPNYYLKRTMRTVLFLINSLSPIEKAYYLNNINLKLKEK